jgi:polysaccharide biosynthesis/export protein
MEQGFLQRVNADGTNGDLLKIDFRKVAVGDEAHNVLLNDRDLLTIQSTSEAKFVPDQQVRILGNVQRPGAYPAATNLTVSSLLQLAGGMLPGSADTIEVSRARVKEGTPHETYKIADIMAGKDVTINPGDLVTVPSDGNFVANPRTVFVTGAVSKPGPYSINGTTDRISDVLARAGGPTQDAFLNGAQYFRSPSRLQVISHVRLSPRIREVLNIVAEDEYTRAAARAEVEKARVTKSINQGQQSVSIPGLGAAPANNSGPAVQIEIKGTPVSRARILDDQDVEPAGNLNINLEAALKRKKGKDDIVVMDGDIIVVPEKPSTVSVVGAVTVPSALLFESGKNVQWYVDRAGGMMSDAQEKMILVFRANGQVIRAKKSTRVELGDRIFVPTKVMAERLTDRQADIDAISRNITNAALLFTIFRALGR